VKMGIRLAQIGGKGWEERVTALGLGPHLTFELIQEGERLALLERQLADLKARREALVAASDGRIARSTRALRRLGAIAQESSFVFATELLGWRTFANRRELAGAVGITGTPFQSGACEQEQGISKAGNARMRTMLVEIAWCWLRLQPQSALARWWRSRFGGGNKRTRRVGLVGMARKLLVALWRYLEQGIVPEGATLKTLETEAAAA
jgi:transposase